MIIANPIYDSVFKFLLEDIDIAKHLLSSIIGEEIIELDTKPQEQTVDSSRHGLSIFRVDFKALIKTQTGERKKVLIELQKSSHAYDVLRFRNYLGVNYTQADEVDGIKQALPLLPIYFLGFNLSVNRPVLKIGRSYQDVGTGEFIEEKDKFIENLSHDCFVVQIPALPNVTRTKLEKLLSVFNQRFQFDKEQKWLLSYPGESEDADVKRILRRLSLAAESSEVKDKIRMEETFDASLEGYLRGRDLVIEQKEAEIEQKEAVIEQKEAVIEQKEKENQALLQRILELEKLQKK
jgi:hypothetical protein